MHYQNAACRTQVHLQAGRLCTVVLRPPRVAATPDSGGITLRAKGQILRTATESGSRCKVTSPARQLVSLAARSQSAGDLTGRNGGPWDQGRWECLSVRPALASIVPALISRCPVVVLGVVGGHVWPSDAVSSSGDDQALMPTRQDEGHTMRCDAMRCDAALD